MTQDDIYTKFMIEYDKANITSSYPSLTKYEIATILDKAYLALIAQKVTGNNPRKAPFEYDAKAIEDIRQLEKSTSLESEKLTKNALNEYSYRLPKDFLYYINSAVSSYSVVSAVDNYPHTMSNVILLNHNLANKFKVTDTNMPWLKQPVAYMEGDMINVLFDPYKHKNAFPFTLNVTYVKIPIKFVGNIEKAKSIEFELSDSMAEELINLAIVIATETVESPRFQTKSSTLSLES